MASGLRQLSGSSGGGPPDDRDDRLAPHPDRNTRSPRVRVPSSTTSERNRNHHATDSDGSVDTNSSQESNAGDQSTNPTASTSRPIENTSPPPGSGGGGGGGGGGKRSSSHRGTEWEIIEGLKDGQRYDKKPHVFSGYLHKKRKWPLKGWHKRFFVVDKGILVYGKSPNDVNRGKLHGSLDIGLAVISAKLKEKRLDIDAEEFIYHLKAKQHEVFVEWVEQLKRHRLYRQHVLTYGGAKPQADTAAASATTAATPANRQPNKIALSRKLATDGSGGGVVRAVSPPVRVQWLVDEPVSSGCAMPTLQDIGTQLNHTHQALNQLSRILDRIESSAPDSESGGVTSPSPSPSRPQSLPPPSCLMTAGGHHQASLLSLQHDQLQQQQPVSCLVVHHDSQLALDFVILAKDVYCSLRSILEAEAAERERLKSLVEELCGGGGVAVALSGGVTSPSVLRQALTQALQQNAQLRSRLAAVHHHSDLADIADNVKTLQSSLSYSSSCVSGSEFYDAEDTFQQPEEEEDDTDDLDQEAARCSEAKQPSGRPAATSDTSSVAGSVSSEEGSMSSEASDLADSEYNPTQNLGDIGGGGGRNLTGRRSKLPVPRPNTEGLSLWNLLTKNIGKDLSQVSMPVVLNEPLNMLQRMCEELEYSELLDKASELSDPYERMVYVAAFAVSSYGSSYFRAGSKPFNPLLGETYECIREDKGFRFIAEQVSHHPPVSVCYAESRNFVFWQDIRIKTKFWGKSMEFQPTGYVNVKLERPNQSGGSDRYRWNKVTTCVHNLFSAQRWVDQYGELTITCTPSPSASPHPSSSSSPPASDHPITCKLTFVKASYWSAKRHEITGVIIDEKEGRVVRNLFGKWSEAFYCGVAPSAKCVWRPGTMPEEYELYYGFTRFAMELNELDEDMAKYLPITDTRFRPDQRLLEEGKLEAAEATKLQLEQAQRERRKMYEMEAQHHTPNWFRKVVTADGEEVWEYTHKYWETRKSPGFVNIKFEPLW